MLAKTKVPIELQRRESRACKSLIQLYVQTPVFQQRAV